MKISSSRSLFTALVLTIITIIGFSFYFLFNHKQPELTIGIYTGSSWNVPNGHQYHMINYAIKKFKQEHPGVKVNFESGIKKNDYIAWLSEKIVTGKTPDVIIMPDQYFNLFASEGTFKDLSNLVKQDHLANKFYAGPLKAGQYQGRQYLLPYETNPELLLANQKILKQNKLGSLKRLNQISNFIGFCHQVSAKKGYYGITSNYDWYDAQLAVNSQLFVGSDHHLVLTSPKVREGFRLIQDLSADSPKHDVTNYMFNEGKVALAPFSFAEFRNYTTYPYFITQKPNFPINTNKMPGINSTPASNVGFGISSGTKQTNLAWDFIKLMASDQSLQQELMDKQMGCSVMPSVIKSKKTTYLLQNEKTTRDSINSKKLDTILKDEVVSPKFRTYQTTFEQLDYQIKQALASDSFDTQLFNIQLNINRQLRLNQKGNQ